jgi:hypothetical protein
VLLSPVLLGGANIALSSSGALVQLGLVQLGRRMPGFPGDAAWAEACVWLSPGTPSLASEGASHPGDELRGELHAAYALAGFARALAMLLGKTRRPVSLQDGGPVGHSALLMRGFAPLYACSLGAGSGLGETTPTPAPDPRLEPVPALATGSLRLLPLDGSGSLLWTDDGADPADAGASVRIPIEEVHACVCVCTRTHVRTGTHAKCTRTQAHIHAYTHTHL